MTCAALVVACSGSRPDVDLGSPEQRGPSARDDVGPTQEPESGPGRLTARPQRDVPARARTGQFELEIGDGRLPLLFVPETYDPKRPAPKGLKYLLPYADEHGIILLAVAARERTWDVIHGGFGADVEHIDDALGEVFSTYAIDRRHLAVHGFSDGGSYALSLGITNGDLFSHVIAFSAGFMAPGEARGSPLIYTSHGTTDPILPIGSTSRRYVPQLERAGYDVVYREFEGGHRTPPAIAKEAVEWFLEGRRG